MCLFGFWLVASFLFGLSSFVFWFEHQILKRLFVSTALKSRDVGAQFKSIAKLGFVPYCPICYCCLL